MKIGGSRGVDHDAIADDVADLIGTTRDLVLVHGGSGATDDMAVRLGHPPEFVTSVSGYTSRRTDRETLAIFQMVCCGQVNKDLVKALHARGVSAVGVSGLDGRLWEARRKEALRIVRDGRRVVLHDDFTGTIERVNPAVLVALVEAQFLPVVAPLAITADGTALNVDGDRAAALTAAALGAETLVILTNVPGLLSAFPDESSLVSHIRPDELDRRLAETEGRMRKKLLGAKEALEQGVARVILADGRLAQPITHALAGAGTVIGA